MITWAYLGTTSCDYDMYDNGFWFPFLSLSLSHTLSLYISTVINIDISRYVLIPPHFPLFQSHTLHQYTQRWHCDLNITEKCTQLSQLTNNQSIYQYKYMYITNKYVRPHPLINLNTLAETTSNLLSIMSLFLSTTHILIVQSGGEKNLVQIHLMEYYDWPLQST